MSLKKIYCAGLLFCAGMVLAQSSAPENPAVSSSIQYVADAVDISTGIPRIQLPVYNMPTLSEDVGIGISLDYNASGAAIGDRIIGNCGRGWTLFNAGAIVGDQENRAEGWVNPSTNPSYVNKVYYEFSFMGFSGKFYVYLSNGVLEAVVEEANDYKLQIDVSHDANFIINSFTAYDGKGIKYVFSTTDTYVHVKPNTAPFKQPSNEVRTVRKYVFHLSQIRDNNNVSLATFNYYGRETRETYHQGTEKNIAHDIDGIVTALGSVEFEKTMYTTLLPAPSIKFTKMVVRDFRGNPVRRFDFLYNGEKLIQFDESDYDRTNLLSHKFYYSLPLFLASGSSGIDQWGYANGYYNWCDPTITNPEVVRKNLLQKMTLPSGGSVLYDFESNTYSYQDNRYIDEGSPGVINPNFFTVPDKNNRHNFQSQVLRKYDFTTTNTSTTFTVTGTQRVFVRFDASQYPLSLGGGMAYPFFRLSKGGTTVQDYSTGNYCTGNFLTLTAGTYTVSMTAYGNVTYANVHVEVLNLISNPKKWHYGNGVRIKRIGYFDSATVNQNYYESLNPIVSPIREISYDYNLLSEPYRSSGSIAYRGENSYILYKNVTVTESGENGKTTYLFNSPMDNRPVKEIAKAREVKKYNQQGGLVQEVNHDYSPVTIGEIIDPTSPRPYLFLELLPNRTRQKDYHTGGAVEKEWTYYYDIHRNLLREKEYSFGNSDFLLRKYFYHALNSVSSKNRKEVERVEHYRNDELLSVNKVNYSNIWPALTENGITLFNQSYLPLSMEGAKGTEASITKTRFNLYNFASQPVESQQGKGMKTVYLWGYKHALLVAKIDNIAYSSIPITLIDAIRNASDTGTEAQLITAQNNLRAHSALAGAQVTTFTYKPLIGISTATDPKGETVRYTYDVHNRLEAVKDASGHIVSESKYHFKP